MPRATSKSPARKRASSAAPKAKSASKSASKVSGATYKEIDFGVTEITKGKGWWGRENNPGGYTKYDTEILHSFNFSWTLTISLWIAVPSAIVFFTAQHYGFSFPQMDLMHVAKFAIAWFAVAIVVALPVFAFMMKIHSQQSVQDHELDQSYLNFQDPAFEAKWKGVKIPIDILFEAYFVDKVRFNGDLLECMYHRHGYAVFIITFDHIKYFVMNMIPEVLNHSKLQDFTQVTDHYDRGNDFYAAFLGEAMIYTSAKFVNEDDDLVTAQYQKLDDVFNKINLQPGDHLLDIGCGWGTLTRYAATDYGADATGVTLAMEQTQFGMDKIAAAGKSKTGRILNIDYRDIPVTTENKKYDKITCLEMAEHVGIKYFQTFLLQVKDMLKDDGVFYLQIAGLRTSWQFEDLIWGIFMNKFVFPGADASMPLAWVIGQCESAGFEVRMSETIGVHYSATIKRWYDNWVANKEYVIKEYGENYYRRWEWFLAWSTIIPENGSATCYQIVLTKNTNAFNRKDFYIRNNFRGKHGDEQ